MPSFPRDYYQILGVPVTASEEEVKSAFRRLARGCHPDVAPAGSRTGELFKEISQAYAVLGDPARRRRYDQSCGGEDSIGPRARSFDEENRRFETWTLLDKEKPRGSRTALGGLLKMLLRLVTGGGGANGRWRGQAGMDQFSGVYGRDIEGEILLSQREAARGSVRFVVVRRGYPCVLCCGTGQLGPYGCDLCQGAGRLARTQTYRLDIPPGVSEGQRLELASTLGADRHGANAGNLVLRVRLATKLGNDPPPKPRLLLTRFSQGYPVAVPHQKVAKIKRDAYVLRTERMIRELRRLRGLLTKEPAGRAQSKAQIRSRCLILEKQLEASTQLLAKLRVQTAAADHPTGARQKRKGAAANPAREANLTARRPTTRSARELKKAPRDDDRRRQVRSPARPLRSGARPAPKPAVAKRHPHLQPAKAPLHSRAP